MVGCQGQTVLMGEDPKWDEVGGMGETLHHTTRFKTYKIFIESSMPKLANTVSQE